MPPTSKDASAVFRAENGELERLSALETLKGLKGRDTVTLGDLVRFLEARGLWRQFARITLADLRDAFAPPPEGPPAETSEGGRRRKRRILEEELADVEAEAKATRSKEPEDGGVSTDEIARQILPFIEGNGEVTFDDLAEYSRIDKKVLRHHLGVMVKQGRLERIGLGRNAVYSTL
ncbi:MAG TPA: hypothetical protein PKW35_00315 [Nannocystaceae bacterium]|nr:hypothetical protein [Nannocystaceae bacterium]